jgi:hypothetical protein
MKSKLRHSLFAISLLAIASGFTGCQSIQDTFYEPMPFDEVAAERGITLEAAEALGLVRPKSSIAPLIDAATARAPIPAGGPIAGIVANGVLAVGALWLAKRKRVADKVSASLIQGIDTFRDVLDQPPHGKKIDAKLTETLRAQQEALRVQREINKLLERYQTSTKQPINQDT